MHNNHYSKFHIIQVIKMIAPIIALVLIGFGIADIFGFDSFISKMFFKKVVFTKRTIVGIILFIFFVLGIWVGKGKTKLICGLVSAGMTLSTIFKVYRFLVSDLFNYIIITFLVILILIITTIVVSAVISSIKEKKEVINNKKEILKNIDNEKLLEDMNVINFKNNLGMNQSMQTSNNHKQNIKVKDYNWKIANRICPKCGARLYAKQNSYDNTYFLGCSNYSRTGCDFTINYPDYYRIKDKR